MSSKPNKLLLCLTLLALSGCASASMTPASGEYCRIAKPIRYNTKLDSPATVAAVEAHNSAWVCVCEHDCPKLSR